MTWAPRTGTRHEQGHFARAREIAVIEECAQRDRAVHTVAGHALNADDCRELLEMLGLDGDRGSRSSSLLG